MRPSSPPPTTVGVVAPGPDSSRGRRTLSGTPRPDAQVHPTTGAAASPVHASLDRPLAKPRAQDQDEDQNDERLRRQKTASKTTRADERRGRGRGEEEEEERRARPARVRPLWSGAPPSLRRILGSTPPLRGVSRSLSKGGVPSLRPPHAMHPPIGSELPPPLPFTLVR